MKEKEITMKSGLKMSLDSLRNYYIIAIINENIRLKQEIKSLKKFIKEKKYE